MELPVLTDWKNKSHDLIFIIIDWLTKMIYYKSIKIKIDVLSHTKVIIKVVIKHHSLPILSLQIKVFC